jgi:glutathione synthase/RimK-type ligase-like ATP-grasp enzyme
MKKNEKDYSSKNLLILIDYRSQFYSSTLEKGGSLNLELIKNKFKDNGYHISVKHYCEVNFDNQDYKNTLVLYKSSEDPSLFYKDYIEDILLGLQYQGAVLIPDFKYFRAHHNKVFMEILRSSLKDKFGLPSARYYGTFEEYVKTYSPESYPIVFKTAAGSKGSNVFIARTKNEADKIARKISSTPSNFNLKLEQENLVDKKGFLPISNNRGKFIVQEFVSNIPGDYKIVVYGDKYYTFYRENRAGDFRASGTTNYTFIDELPDEVLDFAEKVFIFFDVPFISIDVGYDGKKCYLFEFQFVEFGQRAIQRSSCYFQKLRNLWIRIEQKSNAESEFVNSIHKYIKNKK